MRAASFGPLLIAILCLTRPLEAQEAAPCGPSAVAASVTLEDGRLIRGLKAEHFSAWVQGKRVLIVSAATDLAPRRILLILDARQTTKDVTWQVATSLALQLVSQARPEDYFGLVTFGAEENSSLDFTARREETQERLSVLAKTRPRAARDDAGLFKALEEASEGFQKPQFGDSVLLFAVKPDYDQSQGVTRAKAVLLAKGIRLFMVTLRERSLTGRYVSATGMRATASPAQGPVALVPTVEFSRMDRERALDPDTVYLKNLVHDSGGMTMFENTDPEPGRYAATDERMADLQRDLWRMYSNLAELYRIQLDTPASRDLLKLRLEISKSVRQKFPLTGIFHAEQWIACP